MIKKILKTSLLAAMLLLASCSQQTEYTHAIPKNALVVMGMELDEMATKAGLDGAKGEKAVVKLKSLV